MNAPVLISLKELSAFNYIEFPLVAIALKSYFDGSGKSDDQSMTHITLGGFVGTHTAWEQCEKLWAHILSRHGAPYLHLSAAKSLNDPFTKEQGWTHAKVEELIRDLGQNCLSRIGWDYKKQFSGVACTVNLEDYRLACKELPGLEKVKTAEAICVDYVVTVALMHLPEDPTGTCGKAGRMEIFFDRNECFRGYLQAAWDRRKNKTDDLHKLISMIGTVRDMREVPAMQSADMLAWHKYYAYTNFDTFSKVIVDLLCPTYSKYYDREEIVRRYKPIVERASSGRSS